MIDRLLNYGTQHGLVLLIGVSLVLVVGCIATACARQPALRLRWAETSLAGVLVWLALAHVPLPRSQPLDRWIGAANGKLDGHASQAAINDHKHAARLPDAWSPAAAASHRLSGETDEVTHSEPNSVPVGLKASELPQTEAVPLHAATHTIHWPAMSEPLVPTPTSGRVLDAEPWRWGRWLSAMYFVVAGLWVAWLALGRLVLAIRVRRSTRAPDWVGDIYESLPKRFVARVLVSRVMAQPCSFGLLRPAIVLPQSLVQYQHASVVRHVLLHEQAHVDRRDAWGHSLFDACLPLLFFHPCYWWLRRQASFARELLADDAAVSVANRDEYIADLVGMLREWQRVWLQPLGVLGMTPFRNPFCRRMALLLERKQPLRQRTGWRWQMNVAVAMLVISLGTSAFYGVRHATAEDSPQEPDAAVQAPGGPASDSQVSSEPAIHPEDEDAAANEDRAQRLAELLANDAEYQTLKTQLAYVQSELARYEKLTDQYDTGSAEPVEHQEPSQKSINQRHLEWQQDLYRDKLAERRQLVRALFEQGGQSSSNGLNGGRAEPAEPAGPTPSGRMIYADGIVRAPRIQLRAHTDGIVAEVPVQIGTPVKKGQELMRLKHGELDLAVSSAQLQVQLAQAQLHAADQAYEHAAKRKEVLSGQAERAEALMQRGQVSAEQREQVALEILKAEDELIQLRAKEQELKIRLQVEENNLQAAIRERDKLRIVSPVDGVVDSVSHQPGEWITAGEAVATVVQLQDAYVAMRVEPGLVDVSSLAGSPVQVRVPRAGGDALALDGVVTSVSPQLNGNRLEFRIQVAHPNEDTSLLPLPGMMVSVVLPDPHSRRSRASNAAAPAPDNDAAAPAVDNHAAANDSDTGAAAAGTDAGGANPLSAAGVKERPNGEVTAILEQEVKTFEEMYERVRALHEAGAPGGEAQNLYHALGQLRMAQARLADQEGDRLRQLGYLTQAVDAAQRRVEALQVALDAGSTTFSEVVQATRNLSEVRLEYERVRE